MLLLPVINGELSEILATYVTRRSHYEIHYDFQFIRHKRLLYRIVPGAAGTTHPAAQREPVIWRP